MLCPGSAVIRYPLSHPLHSSILSSTWLKHSRKTLWHFTAHQVEAEWDQHCLGGQNSNLTRSWSACWTSGIDYNSLVTWCFADGSLPTIHNQRWKLCYQINTGPKCCTNFTIFPSGGHLGVAKTAAKMQQRYYWLGWLDAVKKVCKPVWGGMLMKEGPKQWLHMAPLTSISIGRPFDTIAMDVCGPFPVTDRWSKHILMAADYFSKWPECGPSQIRKPQQLLVAWKKWLAAILYHRFSWQTK